MKPQHIHACLGLTEIAYTAYPPRSLYRHQKTIRAYLHISPFDRQARHLIGQAIYEAALKRDDPAELINVAVGELINAHYDLPAFSSLERMVKRLRQLVNKETKQNQGR